MTSFVTGGSGFVGRALIAVLVAGGAQVRAGLRGGGSALCCPAVRFDLRDDVVAMSEAIQRSKVVYHLAGRAHAPVRSADLPLIRTLNVDATRRLAEAAAAAGVERFVFVSTAKVSAGSGAYPLSETDPPAPDDPYSESKLEAERALAAVAARTGLRYTILRPPLVYGPGVKANFLRLLRLVDSGVPLPVAGIENLRSLIYRDNLVDALVTAAAHPRAVDRTYFVSDGEDVSTPDLVARIARALGKRARTFRLPPSVIGLAAAMPGSGGAVRRLTESLAVSSSKIRDELEWTPPFTLDQGLSETAAWFRERGR